MSSTAKAKPHTLVEEVSGKLLSFVQKSQLEDQKRLPSERSLAEQFGVARGVVREAIKRLEFQGLLEVRQGSGVSAIHRLHLPLNTSLGFLLPNLHERLRQMTEARIAIEPAIAEAAAHIADRQQVAELWEIQDELLGAKTLKQAGLVDLSIHRALAEIAGNEVFKLILESMVDLYRESNKRTIETAGKTVAVEHHRKIIEAIEAGNAPSAGAAMRAHLTAAASDLELAKKK